MRTAPVPSPATRNETPSIDIPPPGPHYHSGPPAGYMCPKGQDCAGDSKRPLRSLKQVRESGPVSKRAQPVGCGSLLHWQGTFTKSPPSTAVGAGDTQMNTWEI